MCPPRAGPTCGLHRRTALRAAAQRVQDQRLDQAAGAEAVAAGCGGRLHARVQAHRAARRPQRAVLGIKANHARLDPREALAEQLTCEPRSKLPLEQ